MTTSLPENLHDQVESELREIVDIRPHVATANIAVNLSGEQIALLMLSARATENCNAYFSEWSGKGLNTLEKDERTTFARGMVAAARLDVIKFLSEHLFYTQPVEDIGGKDVAEATALQIVVLILGNMVMRTLQLKHEQDAAAAN